MSQNQNGQQSKKVRITAESTPRRQVKEGASAPAGQNVSPKTANQAVRSQSTAASSPQTANNQNARALLDELRSLMTAINASNKPMPVPIVHYGGNGLVRFLGLLTALFGLIIVGFGVYSLVDVLLATSTNINVSQFIEICFQPGMVIVGGVVLMALGMITKVVADTSDYHAQHLWLLKQRWERKL